MGSRAPLIAFIALAALVSCPRGAAAERQKPITVLYITSYAASSQEVRLIVDGLKAELAESGRGSEIFVEPLDLTRLPSALGYRDEYMRWLKLRYERIPLDIVIAQSGIALEMALGYRDARDHSLPVYLFDLADSSLVARSSKIEGVYGRYVIDLVTPTLRLAARLFPKAKRAYLFAVLANPAYVKGFREVIAAAQAELPSLELVALPDLSYAQAEETLSSAGEDSIGVLLTNGWLLPSGEFLTDTRLVDSLSKLRDIPYMGIRSSMLGTGLVVGSFVDYGRMGREAGEMIAAITQGGTKPIPWLASSASFADTLDYRALKRFSVPSRLLPEDAAILFAPPPFWTVYERPLKTLGIILVIATLALVILLGIRRKQLRAANAELLSSNESLAASLRRIEAMQDRLVEETRDKVLGKMALQLSHEINNPLAVIAVSLRSMDDAARSDGGLFSLLASMGQEDLSLFRRLAPFAAGGSIDPPPPEARRALALRLASAAEGASRDFADLVLDSGLDRASDEELRLLSRPDRSGVLEALYRVRTLGSGIEASLRSSERIASTIERLRSYARDAKTGGGEAVADVRSSIERALTLYVRAGEGLRITRRIEEGLPPVGASEPDLVNILANLAQNAVKAMAGEGELGVEAAREGGEVAVSVLDSGPGVPESIRDRLFAPFDSSEGPESGLGLGLSICKRIAEGCGGSISYRRRGDKTMFTLRLPISEDSHG